MRFQSIITRPRNVLCGLALVAAIALFANRAISQEAGGKPPAQGQGEMDEMMKKMAEAAAPGPHHKHLAAMEGDWECMTRFWMAPGEAGETTKGVCKRRWILGGRFLTEEVEGTAMGKPFSGFGICGYDNVAKKYVSSWCDSMSTGIMSSVGTCDSAGKTFTYLSECNDCISGQLKKLRTTMRVLSASKHVFEMFDAGPDGKEFKNLEVTYTRK